MTIIKQILYAVMILCAWNIYSQSIIIESGAELNVGANSDICATNWGNITGNLTGSGTQCDGVLPVELISFTANVQNVRDIKISWMTAFEINNKGFELERKKTGNEWIKIAWVDGSGNSELPVEYNYSDKKLDKGRYTYRLKQIDYNSSSEYYLLNSEVEIKAPGIFSLSQNHPNPSNPVTTIDYQIPFTANVTIRVYDALGKVVSEIVNKNHEEGYYEVRFDGKNLASGIYFYSISAVGETDRFFETKKMLLIK